MSRFDERARSWDTPDRARRAAMVADAIRQHVPLSPSMRAIDVGAGTGLLGLALAGDVGEMVLAEPSSGMLEVVREKLALLDPPGVTAIRFDLLADPAPDPPFDLAVSQLVLHHLSDTLAALRAVHGLLAPGGRVALADLDAEDGSFHGPDAEGIHHLGFDREHIAGLARQAGLTDVRVTTATEIDRNGRRFPVFLLLARRLPAARPV